MGLLFIRLSEKLTFLVFVRADGRFIGVASLNPGVNGDWIVGYWMHSGETGRGLCH